MAAPEQFDQLHQGKRSPNGGLHGLAYPTRSRAAADNGAQTQQRRSSKVEPEKGTKKTNKLPNSTNKTTAPGTSERPTEPFDQNGGGSGWFNPLTAGKQISQREKEKTTTMADLSVLSFFLSFSLFFFCYYFVRPFRFPFLLSHRRTRHRSLGFTGFSRVFTGFRTKKRNFEAGFSWVLCGFRFFLFTFSFIRFLFDSLWFQPLEPSLPWLYWVLPFFFKEVPEIEFHFFSFLSTFTEFPLGSIGWYWVLPSFKKNTSLVRSTLNSDSINHDCIQHFESILRV